MFSIRNIESNELIGCCGLTYINWIHRHAELSLYIGFENLYLDDKGYADEAYKLLMNHGFKEIGMHKLWSEIYEYDSSKRALYECMGFHLDATLMDHQYYNGQWWNSLIFSMLSEEYK